MLILKYEKYQLYLFLYGQFLILNQIMEHKPLLKVGTHKMSFEDFEKMCVTSFKNSERRENIFSRFMVLIERLRSLGIEFDLWVDGSFVTEKERPGDIDVVIITESAIVDLLVDDDKDILRELVIKKDVTKLRYETDLYIALKDRPVEINYWYNFFTSTRSGHSKGIIELKITPDI